MRGPFRSVYSASVTAWWCCRDCDNARLYCPSCTEQLSIDRPDDHPPARPFYAGARCPDPDCDAFVAVTVCGYRPNPTGDAPANRSPLSDPLPVIEPPRPVAPPRAQPIAPPAPPPPRPAPQPWPRDINKGRTPRPAFTGPKPCPPDAPRRRFSEWAAVGVLPRGLDPSTLASAYRRRFGGVEPRRDPDKKATRAYTFRELGLALGELGLAPAAEPAPGWEVGQ